MSLFISIFLMGVGCESNSENSTLPTTKNTIHDTDNSQDNQEDNQEDNSQDNQDDINVEPSEPSEPDVSQPSDESSTNEFQLYDFTLPDLNPYSSLYENDITPSDYLGEVTGWYFIKATWGYCRSQFGYLSTMQDDLSTNYGGVPIRIFAINRSNVAVNESLAEQYNMSLSDLWASFFGPSSPSPSTLPFVNDSNWTIWSDWGDSCSLTDDAGNPLHATPEEHWRDFYIIDKNGQLQTIFNLTQTNLSDPTNYDIVKNALLDAYISEN